MNKVYIQRDVRVIAAQIAGDSAEMGRAAGAVQRAVRAVASNYVDTGALHDSYKIATVPGERGTGRSVNDRLIYSDEPAALPNEYGYIRRLKGRRVQYVPGRHIMRRGMDLAR